MVVKSKLFNLLTIATVFSAPQKRHDIDSNQPILVVSVIITITH